MAKRLSTITAITLGVCVVVQVSTAQAYRDVGYDPDDRPVELDPDIRSTTRFVGKLHNKRVLAIAVRAYEDFGLWWRIDVRLDARTGPRADYVMRLWNRDTGGLGCDLRRIGESDTGRGVFRQSGRKVSCQVFIERVKATKRIRWKLVSPSGHSGGISEYAPNGGGWYS
jgi:hypothetical protein